MDKQERLLAELNNIRKTRKYRFYARPVDKQSGVSAIFECGIPGPDTEIYKDSLFRLKLIFPKNYPYHPPKAMFLNKVFHPNVYSNNYICLDIIGVKWKPSITIQQILSGIQQLLVTPNIKSPANTSANSLFAKNVEKYNLKVLENIKKYHKDEGYRIYGI